MERRRNTSAHRCNPLGPGHDVALIKGIKFLDGMIRRRYPERRPFKKYF